MKKIQIKIIILFSFFLLTLKANAQETNDTVTKKTIDTTINNMPSKVKFGCGFGLNFVGGTNINISPNITFVLSNKISLGTGLQFNYLALKNVQTTTTFGVNALFQYNPSKKIITTLEFVQLRVATKNEVTKVSNNFWDAALFIGGGINITNKLAIGAKYNFLYDEQQSIYSSPVIPFVNITF